MNTNLFIITKEIKFFREIKKKIFLQERNSIFSELLRQRNKYSSVYSNIKTQNEEN